MSSYRVLIVDDQPGETKKLFKRLFEGDEDFHPEQAQKPSDFRDADLSSYDAILLDINLDDWEISLGDALAIVGDHCPVVLVSRRWDNELTHSRISEALAGVKEVKFVATLVLNSLGEENWESHAESMRGQLRLAIERERRRGLLDLKENDSVRILHLSDPQYGDRDSDDWATYVEDQIAQFVLAKLDLEIHFVAVTGDITYSGEPVQFKLARERMTAFIRHFFPNRSDWRERLLLVPGNHDVNLRLAAADKINVKITKGDLLIDCGNAVQQQENSHRRFAEAPFRDFAWNLTGDPRWQSADELCWVNDSFRHLGLRFFLLNSTSAMNCDFPQRAGFPLDSIRKLGTDDLIRQEHPFGVVLSHHGPSRIKENEVDVLTQWPEISGFLTTRGVKLFVHGHGHARKVERFNLAQQTTVSAKNGSLPDGEILRVMAPTTHLAGVKRPDQERRGFNLITFNRSYGKVDKVVVESYETTRNGVEKAKDSPWECCM